LGAPRPRWLLREGVAQAKRDPRFTIGIGLVVALVVGVVLSTTGRTAATEQSVMDSIDSLGARVVVLTDGDREAGINGASVDAIARLDGVEWVFGVGPATVGSSPAAPGGNQVAARALVGNLPKQVTLSLGRPAAQPREAVAGSKALATLGLADGAGTVQLKDRKLGVVGVIGSDGVLDFLNDTVLYRGDAGERSRVVQIFVAVDDPAHAKTIGEAAKAVLDADKPESVTVEVSDSVIELGDVVSGKLGSSARQLMALVLLVGLTITTVVTMAMVASQRRNFGRMRALGASRSGLVAMVLIRTSVSAGLGALAGSVIGMAVVWVTTGGELPHWSFVVGVAVLALAMSLIGCAVPAVIAAKSDPVAILRVP
jgi:putative ABC transport system permease protein